MFRKLTHTQTRLKQFHRSIWLPITNLSFPRKKWKKKNSTSFVNHRRRKEKKQKTKLTGDVDDVVVELVGEQRFRQLPEEGLEDHGCQVDVLHFSEVHALSYTRCREREKKQISETIEKDLDIWNGFRSYFFFFFTVCRLQITTKKTRNRTAATTWPDDGSFWIVPIPT